MVYERYPRSTGSYNTGSQGDQGGDAGYGRDYGSGRDYSYSSARDYAAAGRLNDERYGRQDDGRQGYGRQRYGQGGADRDRGDDRGGYRRPERSSSDWGHSDYGRDDGGRRFQERGDDRYGRGGGRDDYHGSYASDGRRFEDVGRYRHADDDQRRDRDQNRGYGRQPQGYDYEERGFFQRAGDEVRSWFGDDDAERRREADSRYDERAYRGGQHDDHYSSWRSSQIASFDRDYDEYRNENRSRFESEFSSWRTNRQTQRDSLNKVKEHQEVVGSDGSHVGTVDKVRGDRILLTKNDADAGGRHHSIPSSWLASVDDKVTLTKTADEAKSAWRDEDRNQAMFGYGDNDRGDHRDAETRRGATSQSSASATGAAASSTGSSDDKNLNRSFSGTY